MSDISQIQVNGTTYDLCDATARTEITNLQDSVAYFKCIYWGRLEDASVSFNSYSPHSLFFVCTGTWNNSVVYMVMPNNGNAPIATKLAKYADNITGDISFAANRTWGITINRTSSYSVPLIVFHIRKPV